MSYPVFFEQTVVTADELSYIRSQIWPILNDSVTLEVAIHLPNSTDLRFSFNSTIFREQLFNLLRKGRYVVTVRMLDKPVKISKLDW